MEIFLLLFCIGLLFYSTTLSSKMMRIEQKFLVTIADLKIKIYELEQQLLKNGTAGSNEASDMSQSVSVHQEPLPPKETKPADEIKTAGHESVNFDPALKTPDYNLPQNFTVFKKDAEPIKPAVPGLFEKLFQHVKDYFLSGNTIVKVGVVLIFFGVSFLLKYAIDQNMIPIELRLIASALFAFAIVKIGWNLREKAKDYGLVLQGGGIGILILITFVSMKNYALIPTSLGFLLLVFFTFITAVLAVLQDSKNLAIFGLLGGFMAPILASSGQGQHVVLFSYYTILNLGIFYVAWKKAWTELNLLGFIFTFLIGSVWGVLKYQPEFYSTTQPFLIIFFLIYAAIPLIFAGKREPELKGYVDGTIVFGNSAISLFLQLQLVKDIEYAGAFSALALAAYYVLVSRYLLKNKSANYKVLAEAFISIGIVFSTIAIPLAFDGIKTSAIWAVEAAGIYWVSLRQKRKLARYFSTALIFITSISYFLGPRWEDSEYLFLNIFYYSGLFIALSSYVISYLNDANKKELNEVEHLVAPVTFIMGTLWWVCGGIYEINRFVGKWELTSELYSSQRQFLNHLSLSMCLGYLAIGAIVAVLVSQRLNWMKLKALAQSFVFVLILFFLISVADYPHPFGSYGFIAWIGACVAYLYILKMNETSFEEKHFLFRIGHAGFLWVLAGLLAREFNWLGVHFVAESSAWRYAAQAIGPVALIYLITYHKDLLRWPIGRFHDVYLRLGLAPIVVCSWIWLIFTNWYHNGSAAPLPYIPILNPLELVQLATLMICSAWLVKCFYSAENKIWIGSSIGITAFVWLNGILCRALHHYLQIPFDFSSLFAAVEVQVALSLFWTLLGIALMTYASKKQLRWLWVLGASLLAVVVFKMFMIDLSKTQTIARVISFIGVGTLFLIVGYFSPIPPKTVEAGKAV